MELIRLYFPDLSAEQYRQLAALDELYREWNEKINVISRKDIDHLYLHHVLHSLALAKYYAFQPGQHILDVGTGGGFPGIPLAILFPATKFTLLDSTMKKIHVVSEVADSIGLRNVEAVHGRVEAHQGSYDIILSRAVSTLTQLVAWTKHLSSAHHWIVLKGGDQKEIRKELPPQFDVRFSDIESFFHDVYFHEKWVVEVKKK